MEGDVRRFTELILTNPAIAAILARAPGADLPDWWLTGGALFQTIWNALAGRSPAAGIRDYDLFYFDADDRSAAGESAARRTVTECFGDLGAAVEVCNEARVHLWYESQFGVPAHAFLDSRDAIDHFATTSAFGVCSNATGELVVHAPFGYADLFAGIVRANPRLAPRAAYETKVRRWREQWPGLDVLPWSDQLPSFIDDARGEAAGSARTRTFRARPRPA